ncbi:MAG: hypothetical protein ACO3A2_11440 [Bdellovibrionia bacterium]
MTQSSSGNLPIRRMATFSSQGNCPAQEDYCLIHQERGIFVIADGFGGPEPGRQAAKLGCESVQSFLFKEAGDLEATLPFVLRQYFSLLGNVLFNAMLFANQKINEGNRGKTIHEKGGASVLSGFIDGDLLALANVGVCSASLIRRGEKGAEKTNLVVPRSLSRLVNPFLKQPNPSQSIPLMALGMVGDLEPEIVEHRLKPGDWLILSTDGVPVELIDALVALQSKDQDLNESLGEFKKYFDSFQYQDNALILWVIF